MNVYESVSEDEIKKLILSSSSKSCDLNSIPTSVLKNCLETLMTPITDIINISMESTFPKNVKDHYLKKHLFLKTNWKITGLFTCNLSFISKISEKVVANQIWFSSYLQNRHQSVKIKDTHSDKVTLSYGLQQGSVLGPVLFNLYTTPRAIVSSFAINLHYFADNTQMSLSVSNALEKLQHCLKKVKVKVYSLISSISSDFYIFTPWSLDLFIRVPSQLHGEHTILQPFRRIELIIHIAISVLSGTHFHLSRVKHMRVECLAQGHNIETISQYWERRNMIYFSENLAPSGIRNRTAGSDIGKAPRSNYYAMSLS